MNRNRMLPYIAGVAVIAAVLVVLGVPFAAVVPFALLAICPVMMFFMMRGMGGMGGSQDEDHTGYGCEHDPTRTAERPTRPPADTPRRAGSCQPTPSPATTRAVSP